MAETQQRVDFFERVAEALARTPHRGAQHVFLGHPMSDACDKTTVEPGNTYSPGVWTCGVSLWIETDGSLVTPDLLADDAIEWKLEPPVLIARYGAGDVEVEHRLTHLGGEGAEGTDFSELIFSAKPGTTFRACVAVRDIGPAGGRIASIEQMPDGLLINGTLRLSCEQTISRTLAISATPPGDSPSGALGFELKADSGGIARLAFKTEHGFADRVWGRELPWNRPHSEVTVADAVARASAAWKRDLPARVFTPDDRIVRAWEQCCYHIQAAMECGLARISAVDYPLFWQRDGVIVLRALDLMGRSDLARIGNDHMVPMPFAGGFGAESDAPGQGIWSLLTHARFTHDRQWMADVFPFIKKRVEWIRKMRSAKTILRALTENRMPRYIETPGINAVCLPAVNGTISGRMDWGRPNFFINCWALVGLNLAAAAAEELGEAELAMQWRSEAAELETGIRSHLLPKFGDDRDLIITPNPSGALMNDGGAAIRSAFAARYRALRLAPDGSRRPEPHWTYFEVAQIHNAILLGLKTEAWTCLNGMLNDGKWPVSAYVEGLPHGNESLPFRNSLGARGWLQPERAVAGNMPHNWTSGEMVSLIRDIFVKEQDGKLALGLGVPEAWLTPGSSFGVSNMPTEYGPVSYTVRTDANGRPTIAYDGAAPYVVAFDGSLWAMK